MRISFYIVIISVLLLFLGVVIYLNESHEYKMGRKATFGKGLLQIEPTNRERVVNPYEGKTFERALSFFFVCGGILLLVITLFVKFPMLNKILLVLIFGGVSLVAYFNLNRINKLCRNREYICKHGATVTATVLSHTKKRVFYSSFPSYGIIVRTNDVQEKKVTFYFPSKMLHNSCPVGAIINGTELKGEYFFGQMAGIKLVFADENGEISGNREND